MTNFEDIARSVLEDHMREIYSRPLRARRRYARFQESGIELAQMEIGEDREILPEHPRRHPCRAEYRALCRDEISVLAGPPCYFAVIPYLGA